MVRATKPIHTEPFSKRLQNLAVSRGTPPSQFCDLETRINFQKRKIFHSLQIGNLDVIIPR